LATSSDLAANVAADASEGTIVIVPPGTTERKMIVRPPNSLSGDRVQLVRELQRELKRVGCYSEKIEGEWAQPPAGQ
jgi:peptidoglycan hydrolase-like protein with peptidoglycan-binding domain